MVAVASYRATYALPSISIDSCTIVMLQPSPIAGRESNFKSRSAKTSAAAFSLVTRG
jgi:hypothetical protein